MNFIHQWKLFEKVDDKLKWKWKKECLWLLLQWHALHEIFEVVEENKSDN